MKKGATRVKEHPQEVEDDVYSSDFLKTTNQIKTELLNETKSLSMLDEKNIIE
jgi:hypothetical protein